MRGESFGTADGKAVGRVGTVVGAIVGIAKGGYVDTIVVGEIDEGESVGNNDGR